MSKIELPPNIIYKDAEVIILLPSDPIAIGHAIIKPRVNYKGLDDLPMVLLDKVIHLAQCYTKAMKRIYSPKGYSIMQNGGEFSESEYFQLHVFPRNNPDEFSWIYSDHVDPNAKEFGKLKQLISKELQQLLDE